jgi:ankyrin repeat protein
MKSIIILIFSSLHSLTHLLKEEKSQEENEQKREEEKSILTLLLEKNLDINKKNKYGYTALTLACKNKNFKLAEELIFYEEQKCDINLTPDLGTPMHFIVLNKEIKICRSLLKQKPNIKLKDIGNFLY